MAEPEFFLVVDFEATCSQDSAVPRDEMEIIEVGAVLQSMRTFEIEAEYQTFVRPQRHPTLTDFCCELTTITQLDVDQAPTFPEMVLEVEDWLEGSGTFIFCSWGAYDRRQVERDAMHHMVTSPFGEQHLNVKARFAECIGARKPMGLGAALKRIGLDFEGTPHRGIDDARNIARVIRQVRLVL